MTVAELTKRARGLLKPDRRALLGIAGAPGSSKSTLAQSLRSQLGSAAIVVPMDGFHLQKAELAELGRLDRMGAPDTFDARGFVALVARIKDAPDRVTRAPAFDREVEAPVADAIKIRPDHRLVIVEGNYLLLPDAPWASLRDLLDETWYLEVKAERRLERLISRHIAYGKTPDAARDWSLGPDAANAALVEASKGRADLIISPPD